MSKIWDGKLDSVESILSSTSFQNDVSRLWSSSKFLNVATLELAHLGGRDVQAFFKEVRMRVLKV